MGRITKIYRFFLLLIIFFAVPNLFQVTAQSDSFEPDDSFANATQIFDGTIQSHSINPSGDLDVFRFSIDSFSQVVIWTSGSSDTDDTVMSLYDESTNIIDYSDDGFTSGYYSRIQINLDIGIYYFDIAAFYSSDIITNYDVNFYIYPINLDALEPDDTFADATQIFNGTIQSHSIMPSDDLDVFWFSIDSYSQVVIWTSGSSDIDDTVMNLYDESTSFIEYNDDGFTSGYYSRILINLDVGIYYFDIAALSDSDVITSYEVNFYIYSINLDVYEPDEDIDDATQIFSDTMQTHSIDPIGDSDVLWFEIDKLSSVTIWTSGNNNFDDTEIILIDEFVNFWDNNDGFTQGFHSQLELILVPGLYYIIVHEYGDDSKISSYNVHLLTTEFTNSFDDPMLLSEGEWEVYFFEDTPNFFKVEIESDKYYTIWVNGFADYVLYDSNKELIPRGGWQIDFIDKRDHDGEKEVFYVEIIMSSFYVDGFYDVHFEQNPLSERDALTAQLIDIGYDEFEVKSYWESYMVHVESDAEYTFTLKAITEIEYYIGDFEYEDDHRVSKVKDTAEEKIYRFKSNFTGWLEFDVSIDLFSEMQTGRFSLEITSDSDSNGDNTISSSKNSGISLNSLNIVYFITFISILNYSRRRYRINSN